MCMAANCALPSSGSIATLHRATPGLERYCSSFVSTHRPLPAGNLASLRPAKLVQHQALVRCRPTPLLSLSLFFNIAAMRPAAMCTRAELNLHQSIGMQRTEIEEDDDSEVNKEDISVRETILQPRQWCGPRLQSPSHSLVDLKLTFPTPPMSAFLFFNIQRDEMAATALGLVSCGYTSSHHTYKTTSSCFSVNLTCLCTRVPSSSPLSASHDSAHHLHHALTHIHSTVLKW